MAQRTARSRFSASHIVEYAYRRSVGAVLGRFFTGLRERKLIGTRTRAGRVLVPPCEYDPETGESVDEFVDVGPAGVVTTWAWVHEPSRQAPARRAPSPGRWSGSTAPTPRCCTPSMPAPSRACAPACACSRAGATKTVGEIQDIECFEPEAAR